MLPVPSATSLVLAQVRYLLIDQFGPLHYCDPDEYPVSVPDEQARANEAFPTIEADAPTFAAITSRIGIAGHTTFSDAEKLAIYREWKALNAVAAQPGSAGGYTFDITTEGDAASGRSLRILGAVNSETGVVTLASEEEVFGTSCPI